MAHSRRFGSLRGSGSNRRRTGWFAGPSQDVVSLSDAGVTLWNVGQQAVDDGLTLVRVRGEVVLNLTQVTTIGDGFEAFAFGLCIVSENAFGIGVSAVPAPLTDIAWDGWLVHSVHGHMTGQETTEVSRFPLEAIRVPIDSKAMRKFRATDTLVGVIQVGTEIGAAALRLSARTRMLVKLP